MNTTHLSAITNTISSPFDAVAPHYDDQFEHNPITHYLRNLLWRRMLTYFKPGQYILDLSCGTGTDAIFLAEHGINVICIDSSAEMVKITTEKVEQKGLQNKIDVNNAKIEDIGFLQPRTLDGVISNFGGLNCIESIGDAVAKISEIIKPKGIFIACIMNKVCLWEISTFLVRGNFKSAFRRFGVQPIHAPIGNNRVNVWYYTPRQLTKIVSKWFVMKSIYGLNIFSPNPNSKRFITNYRILTENLLRFENVIRYLFPFHSLGDHFVVELERRNE